MPRQDQVWEGIGELALGEVVQGWVDVRIPGACPTNPHRPSRRPHESIRKGSWSSVQ